MASIPTLEDVLRPVDDLCQRWAREAYDWSSGEVNPIWRGMRQAEGAGSPGAEVPIPADVLALDGILADSDPHYTLIVKAWYVWSGSNDQKAKRINISRSSLYAQWRRTLEYLRGRLHSEGFRI